MTSPLKKRSSLGLLVPLFVSAALLGQQVNVPLNNWTVPPYRSSGITTMADQTPPRAFIGLQPCRLLDTRNNLNPLGGGGIFGTNEIRTYTLPGSCGIPSGTDAVSLNMTVTNTVANPFGHIKVWPADQTEPNVSTLNWATSGVTESNAAIVPLSITPAGQIKVKSGNAGSDVIIDINGYFSDILGNPANSLLLVNNNPGGPSAGFGNSATALRSSGVLGTQGPAFTTPAYVGAGVRGESTTGGVLGVSQSQGVDGSLLDVFGGERAFGILGFNSTISYPSEFLNRPLGVLGWTNSSVAGAAGVVGYAPAGSGGTYGVVGVTLSPSRGAAGVRGIDGTGTAACDICSVSTGIRGESFGGEGVLGISNNLGVSGVHIDNAGSARTVAILGYSSTVGLFVDGNSEVTGTKSFIEPHPTDASKIIRYFSLEGNESGTYFRGRGKFQNGLARIPVPEDFRIVTDPEGLTVQVTPIGAMATVAVMKMNLQEIVVQSSRDVEFSYTVNGIRHAYKDAGPIAENDGVFVPMSPDAPMLGSFPPVIRQRLISNGTYNADGTVNMDTARRLGWDRKWEQHTPPAAQPSTP